MPQTADPEIRYWPRIGLYVSRSDAEEYISKVGGHGAILDEAIEEFNQADGLNPSDSLPETYITMIYLNQGEYSKAIQSAKSAIKDISEVLKSMRAYDAEQAKGMGSVKPIDLR